MANVKNNLEVDFLGFKLNNPFILASAPPTKDYKTIKRGFEYGWAGAITKSISKFPLVDKTPRIGHLRRGNSLIATQNFEMGTEYHASQWVGWVNKLKKIYPDRLLYVSLLGGEDTKEWTSLVEMFMGTNVDGFELNFSCPHTDHIGRGSVLGQNEKLCVEIIKEIKMMVREKYKIMPKLPYLVHPNEGYISSKLIDAGSDAIAAINTIAGLCEFDIYRMEPKLRVGDNTTGGGFSYEILRPFGRLVVSNIAKSIDWRKNPISATGGITKNIESMAEYLILGANNLQVCSEVMNYGFGVIDEMKDNLTSYLNVVGKTIDEVRGEALRTTKTWDELDSIQRKAKVDNHSCKKCKYCTSFCIYDAIKEDVKSDIIVDNGLCRGCGSCKMACNHDAISIV